jgi:hypothetical protein
VSIPSRSVARMRPPAKFIAGAEPQALNLIDKRPLCHRLSQPLRTADVLIDG